MRFAIAIQALMLAIASAKSAVPPGYSIPARIDGRQFYLNGKTQRFTGTNAWWMGHLTSDDDVDTAMSQIAQSGLQIARVWGFGNSNTGTDQTVYYQLIQPNGTSINYGANGIARLDSAVSYAEKYGVKLVLPLLNNWDDLGGINSYTTAFGGNATSFYTDAQSQAAYQSWISFAVNRYKNSSAIFAWELCNEPRCHGCDSSVIYDWATSTSEYIKSLDSTHLVTLGDEGWFNGSYGDGSYAYGGGEGVDFVKNLDIKTLDYATFHLYPDSWGYNETWGATWIAEHGEAATKANKTVILEEYGGQFPENRTEVLLPWQQSAIDSGIAVDQMWQFATDLPSDNAPFDVYAVYYNATNGSQYQTLVVQQNQRMQAAPLLY